MEKPLTKIINSEEARKNLEARYWPKVDKRGYEDCWNWNAAAKHPFGYGRMTAGRGVHLKAHQIGWALENGPIPHGKMVLHSCDNPSCCNPRHLFIGTQKDNMQDAKGKGRMSKPPIRYGTDHHNCKLSNVDKLSIVNDTRDAKELAAAYGVTRKTIYLVRRSS